MKVVIDSNVLFSALIKNSITRRIIFEYNGFFLFPSYIFEELQKHKQELLTKSGMNPEDFNKLLALLLKKVKIIPDKILLPYREKALEIVKDIDKDDAVFIACALAYPSSIIWSDDKQLKKQSKIKVVNTAEFIDLF